MPKKMPESFNYLANNPEHVADPEIEEFMEGEIARAPSASVLKTTKSWIFSTRLNGAIAIDMN